MPDHAHILVSTSQENDMVRLVQRFKQATGWWFRNRYSAGGLKASPTSNGARPSLWQKSYYDHILRREEDLGDIVKYILENPVSAGLSREVGNYPHAWSRYGSRAV
jgi:REP element-mobilizing transposase RayT